MVFFFVHVSCGAAHVGLSAPMCDMFVCVRGVCVCVCFCSGARPTCRLEFLASPLICQILANFSCVSSGAKLPKLHPQPLDLCPDSGSTCVSSTPLLSSISFPTPPPPSGPCSTRPWLLLDWPAWRFLLKCWHLMCLVCLLFPFVFYSTSA